MLILVNILNILINMCYFSKYVMLILILVKILDILSNMRYFAKYSMLLL
jgi:hypothetical protein